MFHNLNAFMAFYVGSMVFPFALAAWSAGLDALDGLWSRPVREQREAAAAPVSGFAGILRQAESV